MITPFGNKKIVPGNSKYDDVLRNCKKTFIVGTGIVNDIRIKDINKKLHDSFAKLRSFPGALLKHLKYYVVPFLIDEFPDRNILHGGCNGVNKINSAPEKIANEIKDIFQMRR